MCLPCLKIIREKLRTWQRKRGLCTLNICYLIYSIPIQSVMASQIAGNWKVCLITSWGWGLRKSEQIHQWVSSIMYDTDFDLFNNSRLHPLSGNRYVNIKFTHAIKLILVSNRLVQGLNFVITMPANTLAPQPAIGRRSVLKGFAICHNVFFPAKRPKEVSKGSIIFVSE